MEKIVNTMCGCKDCKDVTLFKGSDGVGIQVITNNNDGTFTIFLTDGSTFTTPDFTGAPGQGTFKAILESSGADDADFVISYGLLTSCGTLPTGCLLGETEPIPFGDYHVQVWVRTNEPPTPGNSWVLANNATISIDILTGDLTVNLGGTGLNVFVRIVIIA